MGIIWHVRISSSDGHEVNSASLFDSIRPHHGVVHTLRWSYSRDYVYIM